MASCCSPQSAIAAARRCANWRSREGANPEGGRELDSLEYREALVVGVAQSTALVAGISRDGVSMGAGLARGLDHSDSARFAFLLATPIILAAGIVQVPRPARPPRQRRARPGAGGVRGRGVTAFFTVAFLVRWFKTRTLIPFAIYCLVFGGAMIIYTSA